LTTTFRAFARPALVAVTETVTFSPWTNALEETVCLKTKKKNLRRRMLIKGKKSLRQRSFPRRMVQRRKRFVVYVVVGGKSRSRGNKTSARWKITNTKPKPYLVQQNVRVFRGERREDRKGRHADAKE